ncbi:hypothetical protein P3S68_012318 [Capsicum galapagoense]
MVVSYATEVTAYVEKDEMSINEDQKKIQLKGRMGIGRSYPITAFMTDEEKQKYMENKANE